MNPGWMARISDGIALARARWMVDLEGLGSRVQNFIISRQSVEPMELSPDLAHNRSWRTLGLASITTTAVWNVRFRKIVVSQLAFPPLSSWLTVVLMPQRGLDLPCFYATLTASSTEISAHIDLYSPFFGEAAYRTRCERYLEEVRQCHGSLPAGAPPECAAGLSSGMGLTFQLPCEAIEQAAAALFDYLDRYIDLVLEGPLAGALPLSEELEARSDEVVIAFSRLFLPHPPAGPTLERLFGLAWTARYSALLHSA